MKFGPRLAAAVVAFWFAAPLVACPGPGREEGLDAAKLPAGLQADYGVFAQKCSKCHSLSRPLESGIVDDAFWKAYVERMRRQPASGISPADEAPILRFLHFYSQAGLRGQDPDAGDGG